MRPGRLGLGRWLPATGLLVIRRRDVLAQKKEGEEKLSACCGESSATGLQLRVRVVVLVLAALLAMQSAKDFTGSPACF
jgi:hypothetical protein